jgi:hypothetical protein
MQGWTAAVAYLQLLALCVGKRGFAAGASMKAGAVALAGVVHSAAAEMCCWAQQQFAVQICIVCLLLYLVDAQWEVERSRGHPGGAGAKGASGRLLLCSAAVEAQAHSATTTSSSKPDLVT